MQTDVAQGSKEGIDKCAFCTEQTRSTNVSNSKLSCKASDSLEEDSNSQFAEGAATLNAETLYEVTVWPSP